MSKNIFIIKSLSDIAKAFWKIKPFIFRIWVRTSLDGFALIGSQNENKSLKPISNIFLESKMSGL